MVALNQYKGQLSQIQEETSMTEDYQPTWQSRMFVGLLGRRRACTLLDAAQLMASPEFQSFQQREAISRTATIIIAVTPLLVVSASVFFSRGLFRSASILSPRKLIFDAGLVGTGCFCGAWVLAGLIEEDVWRGKAPFLRGLDPDFMLHFDILATKYGIDEQTQTQGIFSKVQMQGWLKEYAQKSSGELARGQGSGA